MPTIEKVICPECGNAMQPRTLAGHKAVHTRRRKIATEGSPTKAATSTSRRRTARDPDPDASDRAESYLRMDATEYADRVRARVLRDAHGNDKLAADPNLSQGSRERYEQFSEWVRRDCQQLIDRCEFRANRFRQVERDAGRGGDARDDNLADLANRAWREQMGRLRDIASYRSVLRLDAISVELEEHLDRVIS